VIPRIQSGTSFKGAGLYYLHDKKREGETVRLTTDRVAWTHSLNTLEDDPHGVLAEMRQTAFDQGMLKHLAGERGDGRPTERTVLTVALAWSPDQKPDQQDMIDAGVSFLNHMGWSEHQVLFVAHNDTKHPHVHLIINRVHPETGMTLDDTWSKRRAQRWALAYEQEHGRVYCEAREAKYGQSKDVNVEAMNYREWREWKGLSKDSGYDPEFARSIISGEWALLKDAQQKERLAHWRETTRQRKELRAELHEQVREEFADEWKDYVELRDQRMEKLQERERDVRHRIAKLRRDRKPGSQRMIDRARDQEAKAQQRARSELADLRADIAKRQKERLEELAVPALDQLAKERANEYQALLAQHRADRADLRDDQKQGVRRHDLLRGQTSNRTPETPTRAATPGRKGSERDPRGGWPRNSVNEPSRAAQAPSRAGRDAGEKAPRRDATDLLAGAGLGAIGRIAESLTSLFDTAEPKQDKEQTMSQEQEQPQPPKSQTPPQELDLEAKRKRDLEFYLQQRDRERHHDRGR
jgi:Relaxase/Mobilisation nuclease domain